MKDNIISLLAQVNFAPLPHVEANDTELDKIISLVFVMAGSVALLIVVIGGFRYVLSRGDPEGVARAKNTILYGIVGLIVIFVASSIVAFIINLS